MIHSAIAIQVLPKVKGEAAVGDVVRIVDKVIEHIRETGLHYNVGAFETSVEGPWDDLIQIIRRANEICIEEGADQVYSYVKISYSPGQPILTIDEKTTKHQQ